MKNGDDSRGENMGDTRELLGLLSEQRELCGQLVGLADHQRHLISSGRTEQLLEVLSQRQKIVDRLTVLGVRLRPYQENWPRVRPGMSEADGREADRLVSQANTLLSTILEKDKADVEALALHRGETAGAIGNLHKAGQAGLAYATAAGADQARVEWTDE